MWLPPETNYTYVTYDLDQAELRGSIYHREKLIDYIEDNKDQLTVLAILQYLKSQRGDF